MKSVLELIGSTPVVELHRFSKACDLEHPLMAKVEFFNPAGSVKDRVALAMIEQAEQSGVLRTGATIIEPTSGNTGVGLAMVAAVKGYRLILTMPETMSVERRNLVKAYGASVVLTPGSEGMKGAVDMAESLRTQTPGAVILQQFENPANPQRHYMTTGPELWRQTDGRIDVFVAGVGTGGTVSGVGRYLKEQNPDIRIAAVQPKASPVLTGGKGGPHKIQGIGANFIPANYDGSVVDEVVDIDNDEALTTARMLARTEGLLVGISAGAAMAAAVRIAGRQGNGRKNIIALLPDTGERYLSTELFG